MVNIITDSVIAQIKGDSRFKNVSLSGVEVTNTSISMKILVQIQGVADVIPLTFLG